MSVIKRAFSFRKRNQYSIYDACKENLYNASRNSFKASILQEEENLVETDHDDVQPEVNSKSKRQDDRRTKREKKLSQKKKACIVNVNVKRSDDVNTNKEGDDVQQDCEMKETIEVEHVEEKDQQKPSSSTSDCASDNPANNNKLQMIKVGASEVSELIRGAFGSLRQRVRASTTQRKRLVNSPGTPFHRRRSVRLQNKTPLREKTELPSHDTPRSVKLRRYHSAKPQRSFSPGQFHRNMEAVTHGLRSLSNLGENINQTIDKKNVG